MTDPVQIPDAAVQAFMAEFHQRTGVSYEANIRASLDKTLPHLPLGYEVKKLEWVEVSYGFIAHTSFGTYKTSSDWECLGNAAMVIAGGELPKSFHADINQAKAAAQADFERRVRECVVDGSNAQGWLYFNEDTGTEYSADHPVISGECPDAQDIKPATNENLLHELLSSWKAWAEDRQEIADLRDEIATKPVDVAASSLWQIASPEELAAGWGYAGTDTDKIRNDAAFDCGYDATLEFTEAVMKIADQRLRSLSAEPAQGEQWQPTKQSIRNVLKSYVDAGMQLADNLDDISNEILRLPPAPTTEAG